MQKKIGILNWVWPGNEVNVHSFAHTHTHTQKLQSYLGQYLEAVEKGDTATVESLLNSERVSVDTPLKVEFMQSGNGT